MTSVSICLDRRRQARPRISWRDTATAPAGSAAISRAALQRDIVDCGGIDHGVDDAGLFRLRGRQRPAHDQHREGARMAHAHRRQQARCRFGNEAELEERRRETLLGGGDDMIAMQQHGRADADGNAADGRDQRLSVVRQSVEKFDGDRPQAPLWAAFEKSPMSLPAQNAPGAPASMTQRIASLASASRKRARHLGIHRLRQRVLLLRPVHPDDADAAIIGYDD